MAVWRVRSEDRHGTMWLLGGPNDADSIRRWFSWGSREDARTYPTKTAAQKSARGCGHKVEFEEDDD
jgi:hypothetical protein